LALRLSEGLGVAGCAWRARLASDTKLWAPSVPAHDQHVYAVFGGAIDDRVWEHTRGEELSAALSGRSKSGVGKHKIDNSLDLGDKPSCERWRSIAFIEGGGFRNVFLSVGMKRCFHPGKRASSRAIAASKGTVPALVAPISASLSSARASQAASISSSSSRLAKRRSARCDRSAGANLRASASRASKVLCMELTWVCVQ
jgi:hypothetical protein